MNKWSHIIVKLTLVALPVITGLLLWKAKTITSLGDATEDTLTLRVIATEISRSERDAVPREAWAAIQRTDTTESSKTGHASYRLAGTFFVMGSEGEGREGQRLAIVDDLSANRQHIVSEGQSFDGHDILRIYQDRLIMRRDGVEIELSLSFKDGPTSRTVAASDTSPPPEVDPYEVALEENRFGKRIGESRWVIQKQALIDYYQELLNEPERIAAIYMSLKPDYQEGEVAGYYLEKEGEAEFFNAMGLQEGDQIRAVNSMRMTSQARAEYFISEFMNDRLSAVVIDLDRNGVREKMIYLLR